MIVTYLPYVWINGDHVESVHFNQEITIKSANVTLHNATSVTMVSGLVHALPEHIKGVAVATKYLRGESIEEELASQSERAP